MAPQSCNQPVMIKLIILLLHILYNNILNMSQILRNMSNMLGQFVHLKKPVTDWHPFTSTFKIHTWREDDV